jgi:MOSC domain-containing protein YiiM
MQVQGWLKLFTEDARPGTYFRVVVPGPIRAGDAIEVLHRPAHEVTIATMFRAMTIERELLPSLLAAGPDLTDDVAALVAGAR